MIDREWTFEELEKVGNMIRSLASWDYMNETRDLNTSDLFDSWLEGVKDYHFNQGFDSGRG